MGVREVGAGIGVGEGVEAEVGVSGRKGVNVGLRCLQAERLGCPQWWASVISIKLYIPGGCAKHLN
jgi:hypothetical protein